ncbi:hypothetical protein ACA910_019935 [Epithemia clementina (nom. ined.)]
MSANNKNNKSAFLIGWCRFQEQWWWAGLLLTQRHYVLSTSKSSWKLGKYQNTANNNTMLSSTLVSASSLCIDVGDWHSWQLGVVRTRSYLGTCTYHTMPQGQRRFHFGPKGVSNATLWYTLSLSGSSCLESLNLLIPKDNHCQMFLSLSEISDVYKSIQDWIPTEAFMLRHV